MKRRRTNSKMLILAALALSILGCKSSGKDHVKVLEDDVQGSVKSLIPVYDSIQDEESLRAALSRFVEIQRAMEDAAKKLESLGKLSSSGKERVRNWQGDFENLTAELDRALKGARKRMGQCQISQQLRDQYLGAQLQFKLALGRIERTVTYLLIA